MKIVSELFYKIVSPERKWYWFPAFAILKLVSLFYLLGYRFRRRAYKSGVFPRRSLDGRVISVGNLTLGGTGKTSVVMMIAEMLRDDGLKPAILSRGYGGKSKAAVNVVCDGKRTLLAAEQVGDEAVMMAEKLKGVPILTGANRCRTGKYALENFGADTLILDDGFQHLALNRDLDILLVDYSAPLGNGNLFPAGELREPPEEAGRADIICFTRCSQKPGNFDPRIPSSVPKIKMRQRLSCIIRVDDDEVLSAAVLKNAPVAAFCGLAKPESFRQMLLDAQAQLKFFRAFPDHHPYTSRDVEELQTRAAQEGARFLLVTEKDAVKLKGIKFSLPLLKVVTEIEILEGRDAFTKRITAAASHGSK